MDSLWSFVIMQRWFSGDVVTNLQLQIDGLREKIEEIEIDIDLLKTGLCYVTLSVKQENGSPVADVLVNGFCALDKTPISVFSDSDGKAKGYAPISANSKLQFNINNMLDLIKKNLTIDNAVIGNRYEKDYIIEPTELFTSSATVSGYVSSIHTTADVTLTGGGGGGAGSITTQYRFARGGGGGGGNTVANTGIALNHRMLYELKIGSGGSGGTRIHYSTDNQWAYNGNSAGRDGGESTAFDLQATGGGGGGKVADISSADVYSIRYGGKSINGGNGGNGYINGSGVSSGTYNASNGYRGTIIAPDDASLYIAGGGGGGTQAGNNESTDRTNGGASYGGKGGCGVSSGSSIDSESFGKSPGGGGGGGFSPNNGNTAAVTANGAAGGAGKIWIIFH